MTDHLTVLGYLVVHRQIRGFSLIEHPPQSEHPFSAGILLYGPEEQVMMAGGDTIEEALACAVELLLGEGDDFDFDLPEGLLHA